MTNIRTNYEKYWDRDSDISDNDCTTPERKRRLLSVRSSHINPGDAVLDLGCGVGGSLLR